MTTTAYAPFQFHHAECHRSRGPKAPHARSGERLGAKRRAECLLQRSGRRQVRSEEYHGRSGAGGYHPCSAGAWQLTSVDQGTTDAVRSSKVSCGARVQLQTGEYRVEWLDRSYWRSPAAEIRRGGTSRDGRLTVPPLPRAAARSPLPPVQLCQWPVRRRKQLVRSPRPSPVHAFHSLTLTRSSISAKVGADIPRWRRPSTS